MRKILPVAVLLLLIGGGVALFQYHKPHQNIEKAKADHKVTATALFQAFAENENEANEKYLDKIIEVSGVVREVSRDESGTISVTLEANGIFGVLCQLDELTTPPRTDFEIGEEVTFKGRGAGMLMDVVLVRCVEIP